MTPFSTIFIDGNDDYVIVGLTFSEDLIEHHDLFHPDELNHSRGLSRYKRDSWLGGRLAARQAIRLIDNDRALSHPILTSALGAPLFPVPFKGSITHKNNIAFAIASRCNSNVGIDLEICDPNDTRAEIEEWCLKEAAYKCLSPFLNKRFSLRQMQVIRNENTCFVHIKKENNYFLLSYQIQKLHCKHNNNYLVLCKAIFHKIIIA